MKRCKDTGKPWTQLWQCFPPGYDFRWERSVSALLLALPAFLSLQYFGKLREAEEILYYVDGAGDLVLRQDGIARPFLELTGGYGVLFLPYFLFLAVMTAYHYSYYLRDTKSIYLMRRLPCRSVLVKSCVQAPLCGMAVGLAAGTTLCMLYYGIYLLVMPGECMPRFL